MGVSRNVESKPRLMPDRRAIVRNTSRLLASRNVSESGIFTSDWEIEADRRQVARPLDERLELGFSFTRHRDSGSELISCVG